MKNKRIQNVKDKYTDFNIFSISTNILHYGREKNYTINKGDFFFVNIFFLILSSQ